MTSPAKRPYRKRKRAQSEEETRRRITEAAVELHGTVGPANTTVTDVAKRAGVSRMTVYNHFPTDTDLFVACSGHWGARNPFPDPSEWSSIADPSERLSVALRDLHGWYRRNKGMLEKVFRDAPVVPSLGELWGDMWGSYTAGVVRSLAEGWPIGTEDAPALRAVLSVVIDFPTWRSLIRSDLDAGQAAELAADMVRGLVCLEEPGTG
ncbi:MAG: TetR/AcrR family transcriptional regulator [Gemmatimonadota bacterium]